MLTATNSGRGWHSQFVCPECIVGLGLATKPCPHQAQALRTLTMAGRFGRKKPCFLCILNEWVSAIQARLNNLWLHSSENGERNVNLTPSVTPKIDDTLKLSNCKATTQVTQFFHTKSRMFPPFYRDKLGSLVHTSFCEPMSIRCLDSSTPCEYWVP